MHYYEVLNEKEELLDIVDSRALRYSFNGKIFACLEDQAQYVYAAGQLYRVGWLHKEDEELKGKYPEALMRVSSQEEYEKYMK